MNQCTRISASPQPQLSLFDADGRPLERSPITVTMKLTVDRACTMTVVVTPHGHAAVPFGARTCRVHEAVLQVLRDAGKPIKGAVIAARLKQEEGSVRRKLGRMIREGLIRNGPGGYYIPTPAAASRNGDRSNVAQRSTLIS